MTGTATAAGLLRALRHLLPDAILSVTNERPWRSLTFTGTQLCLSAVIVGESHDEVAAEYVQILPDYEFKLRRQLVADIAVSEHVTDKDTSCLVIHALLLND